MSIGVRCETTASSSAVAPKRQGPTSNKCCCRESDIAAEGQAAASEAVAALRDARWPFPQTSRLADQFADGWQYRLANAGDDPIWFADYLRLAVPMLVVTLLLTSFCSRQASSRTRRSLKTAETSIRPPSWATMARSISSDSPISPVSI